jgi:hypothetical protein
MYRLAAIVFLTLGLAGQQPEVAKFKTTTRLVVVDVFVRARNGKALDNLKKEDFTLLENGKAQEIAVFEFQRIADEAAQPAVLAVAPASAPALAPAMAAQANVINVQSAGKVQYRD